MTTPQNEFFYKMSTTLRKGLAETQAKVNDLYRIDELEDYINIPDSPIEHIKAALMPLVVQVSDFQDYAETVTNRMELDLQDVDIPAMLDGVLMMADQLAEHKGGIEIEDEIPEDLPIIEGDPTRLSQALMHYIHNAVKFTEKGIVTVRVKREANNILFEVSDTGIGIAEADQEKVFEPFETILEDKNDPCSETRLRSPFASPTASNADMPPPTRTIRATQASLPNTPKRQHLTCSTAIRSDALTQ